MPPELLAHCRTGARVIDTAPMTLDEIEAEFVAAHVAGLDVARLPLVKVLEAGTWFAGRALAAERRPGGGPPIAIASDGTVF